jgi:hypothetical protein
MKTVVIVVSLVALLTIGYIASFRGLDLRRSSSWLYGVICFLCGITLIMGLKGNLIDGLMVGAIFAFVTLFTGATMRWHKLRYKGRAKSLLLQYGKEDDPSLFAKLVRRLLGKYK